MKISRNTTAKSQILNLINQSKVALSHSEIQSALDGLCDRVTIYRVLERILSEGAIHKIVTLDGVVKYASCHDCTPEHKHNHIHFCCSSCKTVTCLENVKPEFSLPKNYRVSEINFTLTGICPNCL